MSSPLPNDEIYVVNIVNTRTNKPDVKDGKYFPDAIYVGRPTPLGNPFTAKQHGGKEKAIAMFKDWLNLQWRTDNEVVVKQLKLLAAQLKRDGEITLSCWCAPAACHAEVIGDAIFKIIEKDLL